MISGTAKSTAMITFSKMMATLWDRERMRMLAERRELVREGNLPGPSALPFVVALDVDHVDVDSNDIILWRDEKLADHHLTENVKAILARVVTGDREIWFDADGNAFMSFELEDDATLFRLALEARP